MHTLTRSLVLAALIALTGSTAFARVPWRVARNVGIASGGIIKPWNKAAYGFATLAAQKLAEGHTQWAENLAARAARNMGPHARPKVQNAVNAIQGIGQ